MILKIVSDILKLLGANPTTIVGAAIILYGHKVLREKYLAYKSNKAESLNSLCDVCESKNIEEIPVLKLELRLKDYFKTYIPAHIVYFFSSKKDLLENLERYSSGHKYLYFNETTTYISVKKSLKKLKRKFRFKFVQYFLCGMPGLLLLFKSTAIYTTDPEKILLTVMVGFYLIFFAVDSLFEAEKASSAIKLYEKFCELNN